MKQVAIYGKGGIGKSTTSANISYLLSKNKLKVVQIGCDPKHDSTRLLLGGRTQTTILDHISSGSKDDGEVVVSGKNGVVCMETGGPEPGVGCAGRGILTAFDLIKEKSLIAEDTDVILYDVLGDVVCGGFAVPLRKQYANVVFIVTSGEFMSLYAANNVLKGIRNFDAGDARIAGLILNSRGNEGEYEYVKNFADAVKLPIVAVIPRSRKFSMAESNGVTVAEMFPDSEEVESYMPIVETIRNEVNGISKLYEASPLNDDDLDLVAKGIKVKPKAFEKTSRELATTEKTALRSCGVRGVSRTILEITDSVLIVHGPCSCATYYSVGYDRRLITERRPDLLSSNYRSFSTELDDNASIFGGGKLLEKKILERIDAGNKVIFVLTVCVPGIIGDDTVNICKNIEKRHPGVDIVPIAMEGVLCGGGFQAMDIAMEAICTLVNKDVQPDMRLVNILGSADTEDRVRDACDDTEYLLNGLGMGVNCYLFRRNTTDEIRNLRRGRINLLNMKSMNADHQAGIIRDATGIDFYDQQLPRGMSQTVQWVQRFGRTMGCEQERIQALCDDIKQRYTEMAEGIRGRLEGRTTIVYTSTSSDLEWLLEIFDVLGVKVLEILCATNSVWNLSEESLRLSRDIPILYDRNTGDLEKEIERLNPTFAIGADYTQHSLKTPHTVLMTPPPGIRGCIEQARRFIRMVEVIDYVVN